MLRLLVLSLAVFVAACGTEDGTTDAGAEANMDPLPDLGCGDATGAFNCTQVGSEDCAGQNVVGNDTIVKYEAVPLAGSPCSTDCKPILVQVCTASQECVETVDEHGFTLADCVAIR